MSSDRLTRRSAILGLCALGGCGFAPVYGENDALRGKIAFQTDDTVAGFQVRGRLEERLGQSSNPLYRLRVTRTVQSRTSSITSDGNTTRYNVVGTANWVLTDLSSGRRVKTGRAQAFTSYSATGSTNATQAAADDARARLSVILADRIVSQLLIFSAELAE